MGTCVCLLLLALALPQAAGGSNKRPGGPPGVRWREGDRDCTLTKGTDGVCKPSTWTPEDHRPTMQVELYQVSVTGPTDAVEQGRGAEQVGPDEHLANQQ